MFNHIAKVSAAAALLLALPTIANAQTIAYSNAPVAVTSCNIAPSTDRLSFVGPISYGSLLLRPATDVALGYVNTSNVAATAVTFALSDGTTTRNVIATGNFAPGANAQSNFSLNGDAVANANCTVAQVRFADGHVWQAQPSVVSVR